MYISAQNLDLVVLRHYTWINIKMVKLKIPALIISLIFSLTQFCIGDDVLLEIMKVVTELKEENKALAKKVNTLQELDQQKEHRIVMFESKNNKLFKYIKSLDKTLKEAQQNITESKVMQFFIFLFQCTVRPWAARALKMHVFKLGPKKFEMHVFARFLIKFSFYEKASKICAIVLMVLTFTK